MDISVKTWNGNNLQSFCKTSIPPEAVLGSQVTVNTINLTDTPPLYAGIQLKGGTIPMEIVINEGEVISTRVDTIAGWFNRRDNALYQLVVTDLTTGYDYYVYAKALGITEWTGTRSIKVSVFAPDPVWTRVTQSSSSWSITASGNTKALTIGGNDFNNPIIEWTPTSPAAGGWGYRRYIRFFNPSTTEIMDKEAVDITDNGWSTTALVPAKMQADGDDVRVMVDGNFVPCWVDSPNTANTKVWIRLSEKAQRKTVIRTGVSNVGTPATIDLNLTSSIIDTSNFLMNIPSSGRILLKSGATEEEFLYSSKKIATGQLVVSARAQRNTTNQTFGIGADIYFLEHDIVLMYGNSSAAAPNQNELIKPIINLNTSRNAYHIFEDLADKAGRRAEIWSLIQRLGHEESYFFPVTHDGGNATVYSVVGMKVAPYLNKSTLTGDTGHFELMFYSPFGLTSLVVTGEKYKRGTFTWKPPVLKSSVDGLTWVVERTEDSPVASAAWEALDGSPYTETLAAGSYYAKFEWLQNVLAGTNYVAMMEFSTIRANFTTAPAPLMRAEESVYYADFTITVQETGKGFQFIYQIGINDTLVIDTGNFTVRIGNRYLNAFPLLKSSDGENRAEWLPLNPGTQTLLYEANSTGNVTCVIKWNERLTQ